MSLQTKVGSFSQPVSTTGNQSITGVGFQPKLVLFWEMGQSADGSTAGYQWCIGAASSSSSRFYSAVSFQDNQASPVSVRRYTVTDCVGIVQIGAATVSSEADFVSMDADGFTINWTTCDATAHIVNYLALGGSDITNIAIGTITASAGAVSVSTLGFKPDSVIFSTTDSANAFPQLVSNTSRPNVGYSQGGATSMEVSTNRVTSEAQRTADCILGISNAPTVEQEATFTSYDSGGFTVNFGTSNGGIVIYLAIKGAKYASGVFLEPTTNTNVSVSGLSFSPSAVILQSGNSTAGTALNSPGKFSMGVASATNARFATHISGTYSSSPESTSGDLDRTKVIKMFTPNSGTPTLNGAADLASLDSSGFTTSWTSTDGTQREVMYLAIGPAGGVVAFIDWAPAVLFE